MYRLSQTKPIKPVADKAFNTMVSVMENFFTLSNAFKDQLRSFLFEVTYKKGSHILSAGARQSVIWFTLDGLLQELSVDEHTYATTSTWFWLKHHFVYTTPGFFDQEPSQNTINVVKDCKVVLISYKNWQMLKANFPEAERLTEMIRSNYELARKRHWKEINDLSTVDRYLISQPQIDLLFPHIQLKHIAEYMGMSTDTLGKLRRKFAKLKRRLPLEQQD